MTLGQRCTSRLNEIGEFPPSPRAIATGNVANSTLATERIVTRSIPEPFKLRLFIWYLNYIADCLLRIAIADIDHTQLKFE